MGRLFHFTYLLTHLRICPFFLSFAERMGSKFMPRQYKRFLSSLSTNNHPKNVKVLHLPNYLAAIQPQLKPPVSNALMFNGEQLKVMIVKGPNQRTDFHLNLGEELFFQLQGHIDVTIKEPECEIDEKVRIQQDEMFLLSSALPHSPQRYDGTLGIVIERTRRPDEFDGMRWYQSDKNEVLYETFFHCKDLGTQIKQAIEEYHQSNAFKTQVPLDSSEIPESHTLYRDKFTAKRGPECFILRPFPMTSVLNVKNDESTKNEVVLLIKSEFMISLASGILNQSHIPRDHDGDTFLWQKIGKSVITLTKKDHENSDIHLNANEMALIPSDYDTVTVTQTSDADKLLVIQNTAVVN